MEYLLSLIAEAVLITFSNRIGASQSHDDTPRPIKLLQVGWLLFLGLSILNGCFIVAITIWGISEGGSSLTFGDKIYFAVITLAPILNGVVLLIGYKSIHNLRRLGALIGMVVSLNLPGWALWTVHGSLFGDSVLLLIPCLLAFIMSAILLIYPVETPQRDQAQPSIDDKPPDARKQVRKRASGRRYIEEPDFLDSLDQPKNP